MNQNTAMDTIDNAGALEGGVKTLASYDEVPYPGGPSRSSHPCHLAMVARLCGLTPQSPGRARVLELGCSMGANLLPMAQDLPDSQFLGVDLSERQVAAGQEIVRELNLPNIELRHLSIADIDDSFGKFDYIICHGVYSWVPPEIQQAILRVGYENLAPTGVMYVDYNTNPGWHLRGVIRDMMKYHVADFETPQEKIRQARALLDFLKKHAKSPFKAYSMMLQQEAETLGERLDSYIYHEHLEDINEPLYFHEFVRRADAAGLRYLADASVSTMFAQAFDESAAEILRDVPLLRREQYMDFLRGRPFRGSLLCHVDQQPRYGTPSGELLSLHVTLTRPRKPSRQPSGEVIWEHGKTQLTTEEPMTSVVERLRANYPNWVPVLELIEASGRSAQDQQRTLDALMAFFMQGLVYMAQDPPDVCSTISDTPQCTPLSRLQARRETFVTNRLHHKVGLQPQQRFIVAHADGTRTPYGIGALLGAAVADGKLKVMGDKGPIELNEGICHQIVQRTLGELCFAAMLVA